MLTELATLVALLGTAGSWAMVLVLLVMALSS